ncbi:MAG: LytTR family DNA-binding domain-containing protein [Reichenbachiella sp.]|uniref:LytR/AlgR family response regulator transcription factor n=1 Tax=Reichenbachiella sp. TaxID=2184521 RepID=UPI003297671A
MNQKSSYKLIDFLRFLMVKYHEFTWYALLMVIILIIFESFQQYYYILQFDLVPSDQFSIIELAIGHAYRWIVWLLTSLIYFGIVIYTGQSDRIFHLTKVWSIVQHLIILIAINVLLISLLHIGISDQILKFESLWDNCVFFFFQKAPIYTLSYGAMIGLFRMVNTNQNLAIEILNLQNQVRTESPQALSIKIGNKNKIIPLSDIVWIEAYDYCVKIHTTSQHSYAMRNSLKALEKKLQDLQFLRVHRKAIVNMKKVSEVSYNSNSYLTLDDQTKVDIAQSRVAHIKSYLQATN